MSWVALSPALRDAIIARIGTNGDLFGDEAALDLSRTWDTPVWVPLIASALGSAYALSGRVAEALPLLEEAVEQASARRITAGHPLRRIYLAEARLLDSRY